MHWESCHSMSPPVSSSVCWTQYLRKAQVMVMIHVRKTNTYAYELTPHWKGFRTWVQKSSFTGEKALAHLRRDCGFSRRQRVSLQTQLAVFAGGKPAFITALMTPTDWGDSMNLIYCSDNLLHFCSSYMET